MRVSTSTINNNVQNVTGNSYSNYLDLLNKIASKKNFTKISENVPDAKKVIKINDQLARIEDYQSNIDAATNEMSYAYKILGEIDDELIKINGLTVEAASASTSAESAKSIGAEIKERVANIVTLMNSKYMDNYIFSGGNVETRTYELDEDTRDVTYHGSSKASGDRLLTIADNTTFAYNITGDQIFDEITLYSKEIDPATGDEVTVETKTNFFKEMKDLDRLLNEDELDYDSIREKISILDKTQKNVTKNQAEYSTRVTKLEATSSVYENTTTSLKESKSELEDLNITKAAAELSNAQYAMQASYTIGAQILNSVSLLNYI